MPRSDVESWKQGMNASSLGVFFVVVVALGGLGGVWLDGRLHKSPLFALLGVFIGLGAGVREMLKTLKSQPPLKISQVAPAAMSVSDAADRADHDDRPPTGATAGERNGDAGGDGASDISPRDGADGGTEEDDD